MQSSKKYTFLILFIPRSSAFKKPFRGYLEILIHKISYELYHFPYFDPNQKIRETKYNKFQRHSLLAALHKTTYFLVLVVGHRWSVRLMKSKIVFKKIISYLPHSSFARYHRIFNFFWATIMYLFLYKIILKKKSIHFFSWDGAEIQEKLSKVHQSLFYKFSPQRLNLEECPLQLHAAQFNILISGYF